MLRPVLPLFEYLIEQDYIAEFLCINKENVALECNGKCYLMQRIQEQQQEKGHNLPRIAMEEYPVGFVTLMEIPGTNTESGIFSPLFGYSDLYRFHFTTHPLRPPAFLG